MKFLGSNHKTAAAWNRRLAIRLLRQRGTLSRNDISQLTQLQGSTLSYIVRELSEKNIVRVVGKRQSTQVGPKQVLITLNPDLGWVLGVSLRPEKATLVLLDAAGGRIDSTHMPISGPLETFPKQLRETLTKWIKRRGPMIGNMLALGVAVPGVVDADAGVVLRSIPLRAVNLPLRQWLSDQFNVITTIDHDACYGACAEATDGAAADSSHFVYFSISTTMIDGKRRLASYGSALYLNGSIYRGAFYGAGELSHPLVPEEVDLTDSDMAALADPDGPVLPGLIEFAGRIGDVLAPIINFVDVQMAVLAGTVRIANRRFIAAVQAKVTDQLVAIPGRAVRVVPGKWEPEASARGAAIIAFDELVARGTLFDDKDGAPTKNPSKQRSVSNTGNWV